MNAVKPKLFEVFAPQKSHSTLGALTFPHYKGGFVETDGGGDKLRYYIHGISYVDERLMMLDYKDTSESTDDRPYYFAIDRMYNVRFLVDRAGGLVERYMYDAYGRPHIRESCGRGDMNNETTLTSTDSTRFTDAKNGTIWDPRADMDDDGDVDATDQTAYDTKVTNWPPPNFGAPTVKQAFSDVNNPFMFQGRPHFALDTGASATVGKLMINDNRGRINGPVIARWLTRDPLWYAHNNFLIFTPGNVLPGQYVPGAFTLTYTPRDYGRPSRARKKYTGWDRLYRYLASSPANKLDPNGTCEVSFSIGGCTLGQCHYGLVVENDDGSITTIDGGPRSNSGNACCDETIDVWVRENQQMPPDIYFESSILAGQDFCDCVTNAANSWDGKKHCYAAILGPNSNSAVACILKACNFLDQPFDAPDGAWGWDDLYDHGEDNCTDENSLPN